MPLLSTKMTATPLTADGPSATVLVAGGGGQEWHASIAVAAGTFGGGSMTLQTTPDGGISWVPVAPALTTSGTIQVQFPPGTPLRWNLSGSSGASVNGWFME